MNKPSDNRILLIDPSPLFFGGFLLSQKRFGFLCVLRFKKTRFQFGFLFGGRALQL